MKCTIIVDENREEEIVIYTHKKTSLISEIEELILTKSLELLGYSENSIVKLSQHDVYCFVVENNKVFAITEKEKFQLKQRLYVIEEMLDENFIKINQSCIVNIKKIEKFDVSFSGTLLVSSRFTYLNFVLAKQAILS